MKKTNSTRYYYLCSVTALLISIYMLYNKALFNGGMTNFDKPIYITVLIFSLLLVVVSVIFYKKVNELNTTLVILMAFVPVSFFISYFFSASSYMALNAIATSLFYFILFILGLLVAKKPDNIQTAAKIILCSGFGVVLFGLMNWFGNASLGGLFKWKSSSGQSLSVFPDAVWMAADGPRLASVFQYSNAYAGYLIALLLASLATLVYLKNKWMVTLTSLMIVPIIISFFLTLSRGGLVVLPIIFVIILFLLKPAKQWRLSIFTLLALIVSLEILNPISNYGKDLQTSFNVRNYIICWLLVIAASIVFALLNWLFNKYAESLMNRIFTRYEALKYSFIYLPIAIIFAGAILFYLLTSTSLSSIFPDNIRTRIENISFGTETVQERGAFYVDALEIFFDYPAFGAGGGAWRALYASYQDYPYISTQAHNFLMQYLVETGIFGFIVLLLILCIVFISFFRYVYREHKLKQEPDFGILLFFIIAISLLAHSSIDFDMSFVYISGLFFFSLGIVGSRASIPWKLPFIVKYPLWFVVIPTIIAVVLSGMLTISNANYHKSISSIQNNQPLQKIIHPLNQAISISKNPYYLALKLDIYRQVYNSTNNPDFLEEATRTIDAFRKYEPFDQLRFLRSISFYLSVNDNENATRLADEAIRTFPWSIQMYEQAILAYTQLGNNELNHESWATAMKLYHDILDNKKWLNEQSLSQSYDITKLIAASIGQIHYLQGKYQESVTLMQPFVTPSNFKEEDRTLIRFYLASYMKLNQDQTELYNQFVSVFPDERSLIDNLVAPH